MYLGFFLFRSLNCLQNASYLLIYFINTLYTRICLITPQIGIPTSKSSSINTQILIRAIAVISETAFLKTANRTIDFFDFEMTDIP